jgi:hypothetical protein
MDKPESVFLSHYIDEKNTLYILLDMDCYTRFDSNLQLSSQSFGLEEITGICDREKCR